jgi:hypothetical protein
MLEGLLDGKARSLPTVEVNQGWEATALVQHADHCEVQFRHGTMQDGLRGGSVFVNSAVNAITGGSGVSFASPNTIFVPVTQVDASTRTKVDLKTVTNTINNVGGIVQALQH